MATAYQCRRSPGSACQTFIADGTERPAYVVFTTQVIIAGIFIGIPQASIIICQQKPVMANSVSGGCFVVAGNGRSEQ